MSEQSTCTACGGAGTVVSVRSSGPVEKPCHHCAPRYGVGRGPGVKREPIRWTDIIPYSTAPDLVRFGSVVSIREGGVRPRRWDSLAAWVNDNPRVPAITADQLCYLIPLNTGPILKWADERGHDLLPLLTIEDGGTVTDGSMLAANQVSWTLLARSVESIAAGGGPVVVLAEEPDTLVTWSPPYRRVDRAAAAITGFTHASIEDGVEVGKRFLSLFLVTDSIVEVPGGWRGVEVRGRADQTLMIKNGWLMAKSDERRHAIAGDEALCGARMWLHLTSDAAEVDCPDCRMSL